jgi:uncharacterized RDD family membrane protein YckC
MRPSDDDHAGERRAPRGRRIGGRVVDLVVAGWLLAIAAIEIDGRLLGGDVLARRPLAAVTPDATRLALITGVVLVAVEVVPTAWWGRTPGKVMLGMRCVDHATGEPPGLVRSVFRALLLHAWTGIQLVGWLIPVSILVTTLVAPDGRGLHDRLAGTVVVDAVSGGTEP